MSRTKKLFALLFCLCLLCPPAAARADAAGADTPPLAFDLAVDGSTVKTGDVITVTFSLRRTDGSGEDYLLRTLQNEILYDQDFFEYVDGSAQMIKSGGSILFQTRVDGTHVLKASYLSEFGGTFRAEEVFCSFRLRVIAESGSGWVANDGARAMAFGSGGGAAVIAGGTGFGEGEAGAAHAGVSVTCSRFLNLPNGSGKIPLLLALFSLVLLALVLLLAAAMLSAHTESAGRNGRLCRTLTAASCALLLAAAGLCAWMLAAAW